MLKKKKKLELNPVDYLLQYPGIWNLNEIERKEMSIACRDTDYIPKVKDAGTVKSISGEKVQVMHEGTIVSLGGYHGEWMAEIIADLNGHHEPQEEKIFYEVLKRIGSDATMIEFGSFWAFYSLWFNKAIKNARNICCEPDPNNLEIGIKNVSLNNVPNIKFLQTAAGMNNGEKILLELDSEPGTKAEVEVRTVDSLVEEYKVKFLSMLHLDVQGFELAALQGSIETIKSGKLRFVFVSTHHYSISRSLSTHQDCVDFIKSHGGNIISSHTVAESFSGDGLIVASFSEEDRDFKVATSTCHTDKSLFRSPEADLKILADKYVKLLV